MAVVGATQGLVAAFIFGMVVNAAAAALFLYTNGHGSAIFRDGLRLVLIAFLLCSALWALVDFISALIDVQASSSPCQIAVVFATIFDQLGRFSIEQYLLWAMNSRVGKVSAGQLIPQLLILGRFAAGGVFAGFAKPQVDSFCVAVSSMLPISIVIIALDVVIILFLAGRAFSTGVISDIRQSTKETGRSKAVVWVLIGFTVWTAMSIPMLLGMANSSFVLRTALPAGGLLILIIVATAGFLILATPRGVLSMPPEAPSPRRINISRDISTSDSDFPPLRYEDLKDAAIRSSTTFINPREAPRKGSDDQGNSGLPSLAQPVTGLVGFGGVPVQGVLFPPMRDEPTMGSQTRRIEIKQQRTFFGSDKGPAAAVSVGKLKIGNPVLQTDDSRNPLAKIATMDLKEAAEMEKERRARRRESGLIASRPAPQPPTMSAEDGVAQATSVKRKEVRPPSPQASNASLPTSSLMPMDVRSTSSGAQLSPGVETLRQRSPRNSMIQVAVKASLPVAAPQVIGESVRVPIRPSRRLPSPVPSPPPEPTKTPLQRRPTIGLPSNPRAQGIKRAVETGVTRQQTVLFVNNIVYNDPSVVQSIMEGVNQQSQKPGVPETPMTSDSVVNRPRPIPRGISQSYHHQRSKSGGSIMTRQSTLMVDPGSPTTLPSLPPAPKSAHEQGRPHPNNTRSMTFDEKMDIFFPAPASGKAGVARESIPPLPPVPKTYLDEESSDEISLHHSRSNRTTKTSLRTENLLAVDEFLGSPVTPRATADDIGNSWLPGIAVAQSKSGNQKASGAGKRGSSPVIPVLRSSWAESTMTDEVATNWGSVHSPKLAVAATLQVAKTAEIRKNSPSGHLNVPLNSNAQSSGPGDRGSELVTVMFDTSSTEPSLARTSWLMDPDMIVPDAARLSVSWHRRVGDECPTFSDRKEKVRSRKGPPPTPLLLHTKSSSSRNTAVLIQPAELSPLESPEQALRKIQEQLKKFEEPNRASTGSQEGDRLALLANLEAEMGAQESHWREMKHDLGRDSLNSVLTASTARNSVAAPITNADSDSDKASLRSSLSVERRAARMQRLRQSGASKSQEDLSQRGSARISAVGWQARLAEAQMEYMDHATELLGKRSVNFLSFAKDLGSPTPPESEHSDDESIGRPVSINAVVAEVQVASASLWKPSALDAVSSSKTLLWEFTTRSTQMQQIELPGLSVRPAQRKEASPLRLSTTQLWRKPHSTVHTSHTGLWRPSWASAAPPAAIIRPNSAIVKTPAQPAPRPVTQRPPRRTRRVTLLPDIVENPEPLPNNRGTLGIFQFPWGEKSDVPLVQPRPPIYMAMPGTMTSGGPASMYSGGSVDARSLQFEPSEYSSSFFDDYEDEGSDYGGNDSEDDGFDENTLWEIASLLKTDNVPSKNSLLPRPLSDFVVDDYMDGIPSDGEPDMSDQQSIMIGLEEENPYMAALNRQADKTPSPLWQAQDEAQASSSFGLPQPGDNVWAKYNQNFETVRARPRVPEAAHTIETDVLWMPVDKTTVSRQSPLWQDDRELERAPRQLSVGLWDVPPKPRVMENKGMFVLDSLRIPIRSTKAEPAALLMDRKPRRMEHISLARLRSSGMWTQSFSRRTITAQLSHGTWAPKLQSLVSGDESDGLFQVNRARRASRTTSKEPAAKSVDYRRRPTELRPVAALQTQSLWVATKVAPRTRDWSRVKAASSMVRQVYTSAQWDAALYEAIVLSGPDKSSLVRTASSAAQWDAALHEAMMLSGLGETSFDVAVRHPVFFGSFEYISQHPHPAATGYTTSVDTSTEPESVFIAERPLSPEPIISDSIRAQIEALEQEKLFAAQMAQREATWQASPETFEQGHVQEYYYQPDVQPQGYYQQEASQYYYPPVEQQQQYTFEPEPEQAPQTILDLQRQMEAQARQLVSTVWYDPVSAQSYAAEAHFADSASSPTVTDTWPSHEYEATSQATVATNVPTSGSHLWTVGSVRDSTVTDTAVLWAPQPVSVPRGSVFGTMEDTEAQARRARGRKQRHDVLTTKGPLTGSMWRGALGDKKARDWLEMHRRTSGVQLRY